ncbi:hypothetical protein AAHE18_02G111700 [Arachis hypogaea]
MVACAALLDGSPSLALQLHGLYNSNNSSISITHGMKISSKRVHYMARTKAHIKQRNKVFQLNFIMHMKVILIFILSVFNLDILFILQFCPTILKNLNWFGNYLY